MYIIQIFTLVAFGLGLIIAIYFIIKPKKEFLCPICKEKLEKNWHDYGWDIIDYHYKCQKCKKGFEKNLIEQDRK